jgi:hypothetical protein
MYGLGCEEMCLNPTSTRDMAKAVFMRLGLPSHLELAFGLKGKVISKSYQKLVFMYLLITILVIFNISQCFNDTYSCKAQVGIFCIYVICLLNIEFFCMLLFSKKLFKDFFLESISILTARFVVLQ